AFRLLYACVVFLPVDRSRGAILLAIDLSPLGGSQRLTVGGAIVMNFFVHGGFTALQFRGFACGQLAALHALRNPLLLIALALSHFTLRIHVLHLGIMLLFIDVFG